MNIEQLEPAALWKFFAEICRIPHPTGHEAELCRHLAARAAAAGCRTRTDAAGNLRIDRPASPGFEHRPRIILQGHLDMVPEADGDRNFDFLRDPITPRIEDGYVTADRTTLGADDGIGVAAAMALICDPEFRCGPLAVLATVEEEVGLTGARHLDPALLEGDILLNLDSSFGLCIGCAGGARIEGRAPLETVAAPAGAAGCLLRLGGLPGGHSGSEINRKRGNAVKQLAGLLARHPEFAVAELAGGDKHNAIPRECSALLALLPGQREALERAMEAGAAAWRDDPELPDCFTLTAVEAPAPAAVWSADFRRRVLTMLDAIPSRALKLRTNPDAVLTSNNLASVRSRDGVFYVQCMPRSAENAGHEEVIAQVTDAIAGAGGVFDIHDPYPGWLVEPDSAFLQSAKACFRRLFGEDPRLIIIHGGVECGIFTAKNPALSIISFRCTIIGQHSPSEKVEIASVEKFFRFLRQLVNEIEK